MYYSCIGCFITILFGWAVSYFTGSENDRYDEELIHPLARKMANIFPGKKRIYSQKAECLDEKSEKHGKSDSYMQPSTSLSTQDLKKGSINPTFSPDMTDGSVDGIFKTKLWFLARDSKEIWLVNFCDL